MVVFEFLNEFFGLKVPDEDRFIKRPTPNVFRNPQQAENFARMTLQCCDGFSIEIPNLDDARRKKKARRQQNEILSKQIEERTYRRSSISPN